MNEWDKAFENYKIATDIMEGNMLFVKTATPDFIPEIKDDPRMKELIRLIDSKIK